jgi:hypothetical protein
MISSWQLTDGSFVCSWSGQVERSQRDTPIMQETSDVQSGYLRPLPDFANHSPFGGPSWFWFLPQGYYQYPE